MNRDEFIATFGGNIFAGIVADQLGDTLQYIQSVPRSADVSARPKQVYRAGTIKRHRRTKAQIEQLDEQIVDVLRDDHPQSVRHVFYRMTDPRLEEPVEKSDSGYRTVQDRCLKLRRAGTIPYRWISDSSRAGYHTQTYSDAGEFLRTVAGMYRANLWERDDVDVFCEVWCESRSLAGTLVRLCRELAVSLYPAGGFTSASFAYAAAEGLNDQGATKVFYIGDYDPAGVLIDVSLERELRRHLKKNVYLEFERIAITEEQIEEYDLPTKPRNASDRRSQHVEATVEAEAMPAGQMRELLREHIEALLPDGALEVVKAAEASEREHIERMAEVLDYETRDQ